MIAIRVQTKSNGFECIFVNENYVETILTKFEDKSEYILESKKYLYSIRMFVNQREHYYDFYIETFLDNEVKYRVDNAIIPLMLKGEVITEEKIDEIARGFIKNL